MGRGYNIKRKNQKKKVLTQALSELCAHQLTLYPVLMDRGSAI